MGEEGLPSICTEHPQAKIKHEWDRNIGTFGMTGANVEYNVKGSHEYFCVVCGKKLCSPEEYQRRKGVDQRRKDHDEEMRR